ncbi:ATP-grasp domain-containing protein [Brevibacillus migulae]|uniref:ATP-grasp domain-containing protein n=1 Tax=Brevibacillus migulae TaxID=1644114 RepID=UPI00106E7DE9|nr:ATP-grasp domain-containing protein [Brevibacillus migulae]
MDKHILVVGGFSLLHKRLKKWGARITLLHSANEIKANDQAIYHRVIGIPKDTDLQGWIDTAAFFHQRDRFDGIACFQEMDQEKAAYIAQELGLFYLEPLVIQRSRNKQVMREVLREQGVDRTMNAVVSTPEEITNFAEAHGYPIIIKPIDGWGSMGVSRIRNAAEWEQALVWYQSAGFGSGLIVEEYLEGKEFSVEAFTENGIHKIICMTEKFKEEQHFVEIGHCLPYKGLDPVTEKQVHLFVQQALTALGITHGPSHSEIMLTASGPKMIETHTRLGGDYIPELISMVSGVDLLDLWARQAMGESILEEVPQKADMAKSAAIWYGTPSITGKVEQIRGEEEAKASAGVARIEILQKPGDVIKGMKDSFSRSACVLVTGASRGEALSRAKSALGKLEFVITDHSDKGAFVCSSF